MAIDDLSRSERIDATKSIGQDQKQTGPSPQPFQSFMQPAGPGGATEAASKAPSPFELSHTQPSLIPGKPTHETLLAQINTAQQTMGDLSTQLSTPNLRLNRSQRYLLGNKLSDSKAYIRAASSKLGVEESPPQELPPGASPIVKFLGILSDGQYQMEAAKKQLQAMTASGKQIHPAEMLLMQAKLNKAQVEIEYSSVLVSNAVKAMSRLFDMQL